MRSRIAIVLLALAHTAISGAANAPPISVRPVSDVKNGAVYGTWLAEDIGGRGVMDDLQSKIEIAEIGAVRGSGGCNNVVGQATISGADITFSVFAGTRKTCPPAVMDQEAKFFAALSAARTWRVDTLMRKLILFDAQGKAIFVCARA